MPVNNAANKKQIISVFTLLALVANPVYAAVPPDSGSVLQGNQQPVTIPQVQQAPSITVQGQEIPEQDSSGQTVMVNGFRLTGQLPVPKEELTKLIANESGKELTLTALNKIASHITQHLRQQGYLVAFAYIPAQDIQEGIVEITVIPGKYGQIKVSGSGHIDSKRLQDMLFAARPGNLITREPLERALLLISDLAGVSVKATLTPGTDSGTADLVLEITDTAKVRGAAYADNWGNPYTGRTRGGFQLSVNNFSNQGDVFSLGGLTTGDRIHNYNLGYSINIGDNGAKLEIKHSQVSYRLGGSFADLGASGQAIVTSYNVSYPFIRSRAFNLYGSFGYDDKQLQDDISGSASYSPRTSGLWNLGVNGSFADNWLGGGTNAFSLTHYRGSLNFDDATAAATDAGSANTAGHFAKTLFTWQRQQDVAKDLNFTFSLTGQLADKNLDSSEKLYLGGADGVRAYPQGEAAGDQGYKLTGELRWRLQGLSAEANNLYLNTFYDYGSVMVNKHQYTTDANRRSLMGAGLGLLWTRTPDLSIRLDYAWKLGSETATGDTDRNGRLWLQGVKYF